MTAKKSSLLEKGVLDMGKYQLFPLKWDQYIYVLLHKNFQCR